ncbi:unnamed protein product [Mycena citricolor]|uniref:BRCT domain-containing protein n=1 Tax=Mycena citricolor TaxID=2018698 RepID=A0AAD2HR81_9AGAR|nr:unnamed protein product [Mycena citricolor]
MASSVKAVQTFGKKKTATAVAHAKEGRGIIRINGSPINLVQPEILRLKVYEPVLVAGEDEFAGIDIRVRVKGGGHTSQVYAIRQAIAKALVAYHAKYIDAAHAIALKKSLVDYDRTLLIADPRRMEPKKFGGSGARARRQKSYRNGPLKFFVDPSCQGRAKLFRDLKEHGGLTTKDPRVTCDFLLVQSNSSSGQSFVRVWNHEKTVLETDWVKRSIVAGRLLDASDDWGGLLARINDSIDTDDEHPNSPLPTPRITPVGVPPAVTGSASPPPSSHSPGDVAPVHGSPVRGDSRDLWAGPSRMSATPAAVEHGPVNLNAQQATQQLLLPQSFPTGLVYDPAIHSAILGEVMKHRGLAPIAASISAPVQSELASGSHLLLPSEQLQPPANPERDLTVSMESELARRPAVSIDAKGKGRSRNASPATLFTAEGSALTFYVSLEVNKRSELLSCIKKHGGQISIQITTATYAILSSRPKNYESVLETVLSSKGTPVRPAFVFESVQQNKLLDPAEYVFQPSDKLKKKLEAAASPHSRKRRARESGGKGRAVKKGADEVGSKESGDEQNVLAPQEDEVRWKVAVKEERTSPPSLSSPALEENPPLQREPKSPTPPPDSSRVQMIGTGKYRYTEVEMRYAFEYITVLFSRDKDITTSAIGQKLHEKMPNHSKTAWIQHVTFANKQSFELAKRQGLVSYNTRQHKLAQRPPEEPPSKRIRTEEHTPSAAQSQPSTPNDGDLEEDLYHAAHFFADGGDVEEPGDDSQAEKDNRIWQRLTAQTPCKTEESWPAFYDKHGAQVTRLYEKLVQNETQD